MPSNPLYDVVIHNCLFVIFRQILKISELLFLNREKLKIAMELKSFELLAQRQKKKTEKRGKLEERQKKGKLEERQKNKIGKNEKLEKVRSLSSI